MSATFAAPLAAVLLAVELLLFEWKPRSLIPVALASATAAAMRRYIIGRGPLFPVPAHSAFIGPQGLLGCVLVGLLAGALSAALTQAVYAAEDAFQHLPIHWMWWPAIGGLVIGVGGWMFPQALGVGYDVIGDLLAGDVAPRVIVGVLIVKSVIWSVSLGSGTSGGVLAPLLMMGSALGGVESWVMPAEGLGFWPLVSMGAILGGAMDAKTTIERSGRQGRKDGNRPGRQRARRQSTRSASIRWSANPRNWWASSPAAICRMWQRRRRQIWRPRSRRSFRRSPSSP